MKSLERACRELETLRSPNAAVAVLATWQHGMASGGQIRAAGISKDGLRRRVGRGWLHRMHMDVFAVGHLALTERSLQWAAVCACGPGALLSHMAAGRLWGLIRNPTEIEVTVTSRRRPGSDIVVHQSKCIAAEERAVVDGIPVTSIARTIVDMAEALDDRRLHDAVHEAEVQRLFDLSAVERVLARLPGRAGRHRLGRVLEAYGAGPPLTRSEAETRFLELCRRRGLPEPESNVTLAGWEVDCLWREAKVAVEIDGGAAHLTRRAFQRDRLKDRALAVEGIQVLRVTWQDLVARERALAAEIRAILAVRHRR